jgi:hypothetical protein
VRVNDPDPGGEPMKVAQDSSRHMTHSASARWRRQRNMGKFNSILVSFIKLSTLCLVWGAATVGISTILFTLTVKETKGIDLENVVSD